MNADDLAAARAEIEQLRNKLEAARAVEAQAVDYVDDLNAEIFFERQRAEQAERELTKARATIARAYAFSDEMATYCSPHGVAFDYAKRLKDRLDNGNAS